MASTDDPEQSPSDEEPAADDLDLTEGDRIFEGTVARLRAASRLSHDETITYLDVLLVVAVDVEWEALRRIFPEALRTRYASGRRWGSGLKVQWLRVSGSPLEYRLGMIRGYGSGALRTIPGLLKTVRTLEPRLVIMVGIAAGKPGIGLDFGDVVVSDTIRSIESGRRGDDQWQTRSIAVNPELISRFRDFLDERPAARHQVRIGEVLAQHDLVREAFPPGEILDLQPDFRLYRDRLFASFPHAVALEMEGGALTLACDQLDQEAARPLLVKAVVDFADAEKSSEHQISAATNAARLVREFLEDGPIDARPPRSLLPSASGAADDGHQSGGGDLIATMVDEHQLSEVAESTYQDETFESIVEVLQRHHAVVVATGSAADGRRLGLAVGAATSRKVALVHPERLGELADWLEPCHAYVVWGGNVPIDLGAPLMKRLSELDSHLVIASPRVSHDHIMIGAPTVEWPFYPLELVGQALLRAVGASWGAGPRSWLAEALNHEPARKAVEAITDWEQLDKASAATWSAWRDGWSRDDFAAALLDHYSDALLQRVESCATPAEQAWLLAVGMLQGHRRWWIEESAHRLAQIVTEPTAEDVTSSLAFWPNSKTLRAIGAARFVREDGEETLVLRGVEPTSFLTLAWQEFADQRPQLEEWFSDAVNGSHDEDIAGAAWLLGEVLHVAPPTGLKIVEELLRQPVNATTMRRILVADQGLATVSAGDGDRQLLFRRLSRWATGPDAHLRFNLIPVLTGTFGRQHPSIAVELLSRMLRSSDQRAEIRRVLEGFAVLMASPQGQRHVHERLSRWLAATWIRQAAEHDPAARRVCEGIVLLLERVARHADRPRPDLLRTMAEVYGQLVALPSASPALDAYLGRLPHEDARFVALPESVFKTLQAESNDLRARAWGGRALRALSIMRAHDPGDR